MTLQLGGDGAITGCTSLENPDLTVSGLTISGSFDAEKVLVASGTAAAPSYTFSGDTDNGLYYAGTNSIGLSTAGSNAILIDSAGKVGIGTSSPSSNLHIASSLATIRLEDSDVAGGASYSLITSSSNGNIEFLADPDNVRSSSDIRFAVDGTERMRIDNAGNVGIGTNSPQTITHVFGANPILRIQDSSTAVADAFAAIQLGESSANAALGNYWQLAMEGDSSTSSDHLTFKDGTGERMRLDSSGRLNIGTSTNSYIDALLQTSTSNGSFFVSQHSHLLVQNKNASTTNWWSIAPRDNGVLTVGNGVPTAGSGVVTDQKVVIDSSGRVGIGITPATHNLHIHQGDSGNNFIHLTNTTTGSAAGDGALIGLNSDESLLIAQKENNFIQFHTNNTERIRILSSGGLTFNGDTAQANALDDYEEGTWTPVLRGRTVAGTTTNGRTAVGKYTKIGRIVSVMCDIDQTCTGGTGHMQISGLPFTAHSGPYCRFVGTIHWEVMPFSYSDIQMCAFLNDGFNYFWIGTSRSNTTGNLMDITANRTAMQVNLVYCIN